MPNSGTVSAGSDATATQYNNLRKDIIDGSLNYIEATGALSAYNVALPAQLSTYSAGLPVVFKANHTNTGSATLNVLGFGAKNLKKNQNEDVRAGEIQSGSLVSAKYNAPNFEVIGIKRQTSFLEAKTTPVDADAVMLMDSADSNKDKKTTIANLQSSLLISGQFFTASDTLFASNDGLAGAGSTDYALRKSLNSVWGGTVRVKFSIYAAASLTTAYGRIYVNGVAVGTERSTTSKTAVEFSEDITINVGDKVEIWLKGDSGSYYAYATNFRLYGTKTASDTYAPYSVIS